MSEQEILDARTDGQKQAQYNTQPVKELGTKDWILILADCENVEKLYPPGELIDIHYCGVTMSFIVDDDYKLIVSG